MKRKLMRSIMLSACVCAAATVAAGQQPARARRGGGGGLDNLSLPATSARAASASSDESLWQMFAPEGAGFSVSLPGTPEEATRAGRERGQLNGQFRVYELAAAGLKYELTRTGALPAQLLAQPDVVERMFAGAAQGLAVGLERQYPQIKFRRVSAQAISLGGYEGREFEFAVATHRAVARIFLVEGSIFVLGVRGAKSEMTPDKVDKFLGSFALTH